MTDNSLTTRVKELWSSNTSQKEMIHILSREGYNISEREISKIRKQNGFSLRTANGMKTRSTVSSNRSTEEDPGSPGFDIAPEILAKRQATYEKKVAESHQRMQDRTRRVRTRGWGGLPADPPQPPRFPSEMTIGQSKDKLELSQDSYNLMRARFQAMCEAEGIAKKTLAAEKWPAIKDRLIEENPYLRNVLWIETPDDASAKLLKDRYMALDVICSDVTKKIRTAKTRITIPDAKTCLGINPAQANDIRRMFYEILLANHFTSKMEAGQDQWDMMKEEMISRSEVLQEILAPGDSDPKHAAKVKSLEVICRDVMKRLRDDHTKIEKVRKRGLRASMSDDHSLRNGSSMSNGQSPGSEHSFIYGQPHNGPSFVNTQEAITNENGNNYGQSVSNGINALASQALANSHSSVGSAIPRHSDYSGYEIDPSLLRMGEPHPVMLTHHHPAIQPHPPPAYNTGTALSYFRLSETSPVQDEPHLWLANLPDTPTMAALKQLALLKHAHLGAHVLKVEGYTPSLRPITINQDDELDVFLQAVGRETATFELHLGIGI